VSNSTAGQRPALWELLPLLALHAHLSMCLGLEGSIHCRIHGCTALPGALEPVKLGNVTMSPCSLGVGCMPCQ
jgi:hypothetical protein